MPRKFHIPVPPRSNFPFACIPDIEETSKRVDTYLSKLFEPVEQLEPPSFGAHASLDQVRAYFGALDEQIRISYLKANILQESLDRAKTAYAKLNRFRDSQWREFEKEENRPQNASHLPLEIVSHICALDTEYSPFEIITPDLHHSLACWGDLYFRVARAIFFDASDVPDEMASIAKARRLVLHAQDIDSVAAACTVTHRWSALRFREFKDSDGGGHLALRKLFKAAGAALRHLEYFSIIFSDSFRGFSVTAGADGAHACSACQFPASANDVKLPNCDTVEIPLVYLPYIGPSLSNLVNLSVRLPRIQNGWTAGPHSYPDFTSHFHHVPLQLLDTLKIVIDDSLPTTDYLSHGPVLDTPMLSCLIVISTWGEGSTVTAILQQVACPKLETAILSNILSMPPAERDDENFDEKPFLNQFREMVDVLDNKCKELSRLSLYGDLPYFADEHPWKGYRPTKMVHDFLTVLYKALSGAPNIPPKLANLEQLSIPADNHLGGYEALVEFLDTRERLELALNTLEISPEPAYRDTKFKLQRLERYVSEVIISEMNYDTLVEGAYFGRY